MAKVTLSLEGTSIDDVHYGYIEVESKEGSYHLPRVLARLIIALTGDNVDNIEKWALSPPTKSWKKVVVTIKQGDDSVQTWTLHHSRVESYRMLPINSSYNLTADLHDTDFIELVIRGRLKQGVKAVAYTENDIAQVD